jgi:mannose-1-phosphate guanylyltransferase
MKAFLLAAGEGRRMRPITDTMPKCLVPINEQPLLALWLQHCRKHGIRDVLINLHHFPKQVLAFLKGHEFDINIILAYEQHLVGSAGTVAMQQHFVAGERDFFIIYADNLTNVDLGEMLRFHRHRHSQFTMGLYRTDKPKEKGIAVLDKKGLITDFAEKSPQPRSNLANAGIYIAGQELYKHLPADFSADDFLDFGFDILPKLAGKMFGYIIKEYLLDIGTLETYKKAQKEWPRVEHASGVFR